MNSVEIVAITVIVLVVGLAFTYIIKQKKKGNKCIGCPYSKQCSGNCTSKNNDVQD